MAETSFAAAMKRVSDDIARALTRLEEGANAETELHNVRAYLVNLLELVEHEPAFSGAVDALYNAAAAFLRATPADREPYRMQFREAYLRFQVRLMDAEPSEKARHMGLS